MNTILGLITPLDPLHGDGYQFWSGIGSGSPLFVIFIGYLHHHNCIEKGCWRIGHADPEHGHPVCRKHQDKAD